MIRQCDKEECIFHRESPHLCPVCSECGCPSDVVEDENCVNCHNCLNDAGFVRSGTSITEAVIVVSELQKIIEVKNEKEN